MICKCPKCGDGLSRKQINKNGKDFEFLSHDNWTKDGDLCDFNFFLNFMGTTLTDEQVKELIEDGKTKKPVTIKIPLKFENGKTSMDFDSLKK